MPPKNKTGRRALYPWKRWLAAPSFVAVKGRDYLGATHGMIQMVRNRAAKEGKTVSVRTATTADGQDRIEVRVQGGR